MKKRKEKYVAKRAPQDEKTGEHACKNVSKQKKLTLVLQTLKWSKR